MAWVNNLAMLFSHMADELSRVCVAFLAVSALPPWRGDGRLSVNFLLAVFPV